MDPAHDLTERGVAGDPDRVPGKGTAEVHSRITGAGAPLRHPERPGARGAFAARRPDETVDELRERAGTFGDRASEWASRARQGMSESLQRVDERLHLGDSGVVSAIRENPVLAAGLAFGAGLLLAGAPRRRTGVIGAATGQLRGALIGGLTAAITRELRDLLDQHGGVAGILSSIGGREPEAD